MLEMEKKIYELMSENHIMGEVVDYNDQMRMIAVEVRWGDWKHEHARLDWLMRENQKTLLTCGVFMKLLRKIMKLIVTLLFITTISEYKLEDILEDRRNSILFYFAYTGKYNF